MNEIINKQDLLKWIRSLIDNNRHQHVDGLITTDQYLDRITVLAHMETRVEGDLLHF